MIELLAFVGALGVALSIAIPYGVGKILHSRHPHWTRGAKLFLPAFSVSAVLLILDLIGWATIWIETADPLDDAPLRGFALARFAVLPACLLSLPTGLIGASLSLRQHVKNRQAVPDKSE